MRVKTRSQQMQEKMQFKKIKQCQQMNANRDSDVAQPNWGLCQRSNPNDIHK